MTTDWTSLGKRELLRIGKRFVAHAEHVRLPDGREIEDYLQFQTPDFAVILAFTQDGNVICERQYKHGPRRQILSLPGGTIEEGEAPLAAAQRELLEETGFVSDDWLALNSCVLQANAKGCWSHAFLASGCHQVAEPNSGDLEEMAIEFKSPASLLKAFREGEMALASDATAILAGLMITGHLKT